MSIDIEEFERAYHGYYDMVALAEKNQEAAMLAEKNREPDMPRTIIKETLKDPIR